MRRVPYGGEAFAAASIRQHMFAEYPSFAYLKGEDPRPGSLAGAFAKGLKCCWLTLSWSSLWKEVATYPDAPARPVRIARA
eukprot:1221685-Amphidinium_carterae.2